MDYPVLYFLYIWIGIAVDLIYNIYIYIRIKRIKVLLYIFFINKLVFLLLVYLLRQKDLIYLIFQYSLTHLGSFVIILMISIYFTSNLFHKRDKLLKIIYSMIIFLEPFLVLTITHIIMGFCIYFIVW